MISARVPDGRAARCSRSRSAPARSPRTTCESDPPSAAEIRGPARPHRRLLRGRRARAARPGGRRGRQRDVAAHAGRRRARVRDAGAGGARPVQRRDRRGRQALRARLPPGQAAAGRACCCWRSSPQLLGQPLQIGKGGLREGVILDLLNGERERLPREARGLAWPSVRRASVIAAAMAKAEPIPELTADEPYAEAAAKIVAVRGRGAGRARRRACWTPATSSGSTTCGSPRAGCGRRSRSSSRASRAKPYGQALTRGEGARRRARASGATATWRSPRWTTSTTRWRRPTAAASPRLIEQLRGEQAAGERGAGAAGRRASNLKALRESLDELRGRGAEAAAA